MDEPNLSALPVEELDKKISAGLSEPTEPSATPATAGTPAVSTSGGSSETPAPGAGEQPAAAQGNEGTPLYAGRYKTVEDFEKGLAEITGTLNLPADTFQHLLKAAKDSGDYKAVEALYKSYQGLHTQLQQQKTSGADNGQPPAKASADRIAAAKEKLPPEQKASLEKWEKEELGRELAKHPIVKKFADAGVDWPRTTEEVQALADSDNRDERALYRELSAAISEIRTGINADVDAYFASLTGVEAALTEARTAGTEYISGLNTKYALGLTEDKMKEIVEEALRSPGFIENRDGVDYPVKDAVRRFFNMQYLEGHIPAIALSSQGEGRSQHATDLKNLHQDVIRSASTTEAAAAGKRTSGPAIDIKAQPERVRELGTDDLNRRINETLLKD